MKTSKRWGAAATAVAIAAVFAAAAARPKKGFVGDIEQLTAGNSAFRKVLYTGRHMQLVLMTLRPGEEIGLETHPAVDQFFRFESGTGEISIDGSRSAVKAGMAVIVPAGAAHNVKNTGDKPLTLYTIYAPPQHADGTVQASKAEAEKSNERFNGKTTE